MASPSAPPPPLRPSGPKPKECPATPPSTPSPSKRMRFLPDTDPTAATATATTTTTSTCFHCKNQGHRVRDCPFKFETPPRSQDSQHSQHYQHPQSYTTPTEVEIECHHGHGPCTAKVSRSTANPDRIYYACSHFLPNGKKCNFFKWHDQLKMENTTPSPSRSEYPMCSCGAGLCRLMLETSQPNAGRFYFVCPISKGHGACPFFLWFDGQANTRLTAHVDESMRDAALKPSLNGHQPIETFNYDLDEDDELSFEHPKRMTLELKEIEEETLIGREEYDDTSNMETSTGFSNLHAVPREHLHDPVTQEDSVMEKAPQVSQKTSLHDDIHHQQIERWRQIGDRSHQILGLHIFGWLGRVAFPPSGCLTVPPPKPLFSCVFPSLDPIIVPKKTYESHAEGLIHLPRIPSHFDFHSLPQIPNQDDSQPLRGVLFELSGLKNLLGPLQDSAVVPTEEALEQAALPIQNLLLTLLESMDPGKHESMTRAADCTFAALDHLAVNYRPFSDRVRKFISCASSLAEIERSMQDELSSEELIKWYHNEKNRFETISRTHADTVGAFTTCDHRLQSLRKEASRVREMLLQIENQVSVCEAEVSELKARVGEASKDMIESEKRLQGAAEKAEAAMELCHQREVTRSAARAAFEEARVKLR